MTSAEEGTKQDATNEALAVDMQNLQFETKKLKDDMKGLDENITKVNKYVHNELMKLYEMLEGKGLKKAIQKALKDAGIEERLEALENGEAGGGTDLTEIRKEISVTKFDLEETYKSEVLKLHQEIIRIIERLDKVEERTMEKQVSHT